MTSDEQKKLAGLLANEAPEELRYKYEQALQQEILGLLLTDSIFLIQSLQLIQPYYFTEAAHQEICKFLFSYFEKYNVLPTKFIVSNHLKEKFAHNPTKSLLYVGELEYILSNNFYDHQTRDYCLDKIAEFSKEQSLRIAISDILDILNKKPDNKFEKIEEVFKKAILIDKSFDIGLDYFLSIEERFARMQNISVKDVFITGLAGVDNNLSNKGLSRGEFGCFAGFPGSGKSICLVKTSVQNIIRGHKVLYLSLEMNSDKIAKRVDAQLALLNINDIENNKEAVKSALQEYTSDYEDKRRLIIKQFPSGTLDVRTLNSFYSQLGMVGFKPDLICLDYVGEMRDKENVQLHESRQSIVRDLRGFAMQNNICMFSALQTNRLANEKAAIGVADLDNIADSYGMSRPIDLLLILNQNIQEKDCGVGRIFAAKVRDGKSRFIVYFKQNIETLDIYEISKENYIKNMSSNSFKTDQQKVASKFKANNGDFE